MRAHGIIFAALVVAAAPAVAQESATIVYSGTVVEYVPHKTIVLRNADSKVVTYTLAPEALVPDEVRVGRTVTIEADRGATTVVRKVTTTSTTPSGDIQTTRTTTRTTTGSDGTAISGTVVEYVPSKSIVVRDSGDRVVTYTLTPEASIPASIEVGRNVTLYVDPSAGNVVRRVTTTTSITPEGDRKTATRTTETSAAGDTTTTEETTVEGVVTGYEASKTVTIERTDGTRVTYVLEPTSTYPKDVSVGKRVALKILHGPKRVVRSIVYVAKGD